MHYYKTLEITVTTRYLETIRRLGYLFWNIYSCEKDFNA